MADNSSPSMDAAQAITALKKGAYLLKYGRWGKPKFCPFRLSNDERYLIWYAGKVEKQLKLSHVTRIVPGQHTAIFQRYPQPAKEYQSFSLIYSHRSLDLICKDKIEAEVWIVALRTLISKGSCYKLASDAPSDGSNTRSHTRQSNVSCASSDIIYKDPRDTHPVLVPYETSPQNRLGKAFSEVLSYTAAAKAYTQAESVSRSLGYLSSGIIDESDRPSSTVNAFRNSSSSAVSSSGYGSSHEDVESSCDILFWGEGISNVPLGANTHDAKSSSMTRMDALLPKALDTILSLDAQIIACGNKHAVAVTKQGQIFSWGEGSGGKLGHGMEDDVSQPKVIDSLSESTIVLAACGEFHTCAVTLSGDLYTWGHDTHNTGLLGHGRVVSYWIPKKIIGQMESVHIEFVSCGPWHTAAISSEGGLFTFGDGTFGALGHGDRSSTSKPRRVESLKDLRTVKVSCGIWHTAAVVDSTPKSDRSGGCFYGKLVTWGDGKKGKLGHGDEQPKLVPSFVAMPDGTNICQVACAHSMTVALTVSGQVYTTGCAVYGQAGNPCSISSKIPIHADGDIKNSHVEQIACGSHHVAALSSSGEVYTWGKGTNGQLGHGDIKDRHTPTLVKALKHKQVTSVVCGSNFTTIICTHKCISSSDQSICSGCRSAFNFKRKRHNCYNCGLLFCKACSRKRSLRAALALDVNKPSRVCDECFNKLKTTMKHHVPILLIPKSCKGSTRHSSNEKAETESPTSDALRLSRLSSLDSFKQSLRQHSQYGKKADTCKSQASPTQFENVRWEPTNGCEGLRMMSASVPGSRMLSRAASPVSRRSTPPRYQRTSSASDNLENAESLSDNSEQRKERSSQEVILLRRQVAELTRKSQILEADVARISWQLKEATETVKKEKEKNKVAEETIRSLTAEVKNMAKSMPEQCIASTKAGSLAEMTSILVTQISSENHSPGLTYLEYEFNGKLTVPILTNKSGKRSEVLERITKEKPSMYITPSPLPQIKFRHYR